MNPSISTHPGPRPRNVPFPLAASLVFAAILTPTLRSQAPTVPPAPPPAQSSPTQFEVASVRRLPPGHGYTMLTPSGATRFRATNVTLSVLIQIAFDIDDQQIQGKPDWLDSEHYDVNATAPGEVALNSEQLKLPMQHLLEQRFHLAVHRERREVSGYAMVCAKSGPRLQHAKGDGESAYIHRDGIELQTATLQSLAAMLARPAGRPVVDQTGLSGLYDIKLNFVPEGTPDSQLPSVFTALQEQLGLKLEARKVTLNMLVIDHVDKVPTEN